jgi:hypothetical protein
MLTPSYVGCCSPHFRTSSSFPLHLFAARAPLGSYFYTPLLQYQSLTSVLAGGCADVGADGVADGGADDCKNNTCTKLSVHHFEHLSPPKQ